ncbi:DNA polymerase IV [Zhihengliuella halotolerans]|uniref:DNA polymerase IV n=1 Tax=Zhihengliuella halotolerans TaxID=370736 RepID=A0A4Q8AAF7_9MICC|nr:DNA polymerase IV [Zhihengliuella halotolerans]RZU61092.1 DNA polymerase-4 [Zhihengliuella halotolerans]
MNESARPRAILHVDMDAFFVSVELLERPELEGEQVIVGNPEGRSVVLSASYECRALGVRSAMPMATAMRLAPRATVIAPRQERYQLVSRQIMKIFRDVTPAVQQLSVDEAFLDVTGSLRRLGSPPQIGQRLREQIRTELRLPASVGVAKNMFVAKIASTRAKPDGMLVIRPDETVAFLHTLPVSALWGVGRRTEESLDRAGIHTVRDIAQTPPATLTKLLGSTGARLYELAWGRDERSVEPVREEKSIGAEETFASDVRDVEVLHAEFLRLAYRVAERMRRSGKQAQTVAIKVRYDDFRTVSRSRRLPQPSSSAVALAEAATGLFEALRQDGDSIRLVGLRAEQLTTGAGVQFSFDRADANWELAEAAMDRIRDRFADSGIKPATLLEPPSGGGRRAPGTESD